MSHFKDKPIAERKKDVQNMLKRYAGRIPIIIDKVKNSPVPDLDKTKYLVPYDLTVGQFLYVIRKRIKLEPSQAIFIFFKNELVNTGMTIGEVYNKYKNVDDEMLYATYSGESTFG
jgi:GABA(A) receptor-associated protein